MAALVPSSLPGQGLPAHMSRDGVRRYVLPPMFAVFLFFFLSPPFQCHYRGFNETQLPPYRDGRYLWMEIPCRYLKSFQDMANHCIVIITLCLCIGCHQNNEEDF